MSERDIQHEVFNCAKMGSKVKITREILIHRRSTGEIDARVTTSIEPKWGSDHGNYLKT